MPYDRFGNRVPAPRDRPREAPGTGACVIVCLAVMAALVGIAWLGLRDTCPTDGETPKTATVERHDSMAYTRTHDGEVIRVYVVTDPDTQVQYVVSDRGGIAPRLDRYGTPMGVVAEGGTAP